MRTVSRLIVPLTLLAFAAAGPGGGACAAGAASGGAPVAPEGSGSEAPAGAAVAAGRGDGGAPAAGAIGSPEHVPGELIVGFRPGVRAADRTALIEARGARVLHRFRTIAAERVQVEGDLDAAIAALAADLRVAYAERNYIVRAGAIPNDPRFGEQWALRNTGQTGGVPGADVDAVAAWDVTTGDPALRIGVLDSGIDLTHPDLVDNLWVNPGEIPGNGIDDDGNGYVDDVHGYDFVNRDGHPQDDHGHGTHVAGIIAARGDNGVGIAGVAWRAKLVAIKFLDHTGRGTTSAAIEALEYATALGLTITNNSWGGAPYSQALRDAIVAAGAAGQLFVAAAGNRASNNDEVAQYPANYDLPNLVAVAATNSSDALATFSNYGPGSVHIAAPGAAILSCLPGGAYGLSSGTSMAAPHVAGALALMRGASPDLSPEEAIALLLERGTERLSTLEGFVGGARRLNVLRAVADPDTIAPGPVSALRAMTPGSNTVVLEWIAPGDDGMEGRAAGYDVRYSQMPLDSANYAAAERRTGPDPGDPGTLERFEVGGLLASTEYWFAVRAFDAFGNLGPLPEPVSATTLGPPRLAITPDALEATIAVGARDTLILAIENVAEGTLDFFLPPIELAFPEPAGAVMPEDHSAKGEPGVTGAPVEGFAGGPDAMGYRWIDSRGADGPRFEWVDVTGDGARVPLTGDDELSEPLDLGFDFPFYGAARRHVRVATNGALTFSTAVPGPINQALPSATAPPLLIAPFWDDLQFASIERAWHRADPARFVVTWLAVPHYSNGGVFTFQAILHANGEIAFQYRAMGTTAHSATAGIQNEDRTVGLTVAHNTGFFEDSLAVRIVPLAQWVVAMPLAGRVHAGGRFDLRVALDAAGLNGGDYDATLRIASNDPLEPVRAVPIRLHAVGAPDLRIEPPQIAFGDVFVGGESRRTLRLRNAGTERLEITGIECDAAVVEAPSGPFALAPGGVGEIEVTFRPVAPVTLSGALRIHSNVAAGVTAVPLDGRGVPPPVLAATPAALSVELGPEEEALRFVTIENHGDAPLVFTAGAVAAVAPVAAARVPNPAALLPAAKRAPDRVAGVGGGPAGGPDAFGYTFRTSDAPDGPSFAWVDATAGGAQLPMTGDDVTSAPVPIGFAFPFYGETHSTLRVCTNGWLSFTSVLQSFSNTLLPSAAAGVPENLIAPFWDDFHFAGTRGAWVMHEQRRTIVQWNEVGRLDDASRPNTFQVVLYADGRIRFQYLRMKGENLRSGTAGIQNAARDDGLTVAYNVAFVRDSFAVEFTPPARWFEVTPAAGEVAPGGVLPLEVRVRPGGRHGGLYTGAVALRSNDPLRSSVAVPCTLHVIGVAALDLPEDGIVLDPAYAGFERTLELEVANTGTAAFELVRATASHPDLFAALAPSRIEAGARGRLRVVLEPQPEGELDATLALESAAGMAVTVPVRARIVPAPRARLSAARLAATLAHDLGPDAAERTRELVIENDGGSALAWSAEALLAWLPLGGLEGVAAIEPRRAEAWTRGPSRETEAPVNGDPRRIGVLAAAEAVTRLTPAVPEREEAASAGVPARPKGVPGAAGAIGARGPDAAGYHWTDSRTGGPAFAWVEPEAGGVPIALAGDDVMSAPIALPFAFPFYGRAFDSLRVSSNGYLTFGAGPPEYRHVPLPARDAPRDLIAPLWADLDLRPVAGEGRVVAGEAGGRFVVTFLDAPRFGGGPAATFQVLLAPDGALDFQYLRAAGADATIGIQNDRGDIGLTVASGVPYVEDGLRVAIRRRAPWLSVTPAGGVVPPGGADTLRVRFVAEDHPEGVESGALLLRTGDPARPHRIVPAVLHIARVPVSVAIAPGGAGRARPVEAHVLDGDRLDPAALAAARPRLNGVPATGGAPLEGGGARFTFPRLDVLRALMNAGGDPARLELAGAVEGHGWIHGADTLRREGPREASGPPPRLVGGERVTFTWMSRPGLRVDVHQSLDGGATWEVLARGIEDGGWLWRVPRLGADEAWIELEGMDPSGFAGSAFLGPFTIDAGAPLPARLALAIAGAHPARTPVAIELALPADLEVTVEVFDLHGARLATLARGILDAGRHRLAWSGHGPAGRPVPPGVYFVRAQAGGETATRRVVIVY